MDETPKLTDYIPATGSITFYQGDKVYRFDIAEWYFDFFKVVPKWDVEVIEDE